MFGQQQLIEVHLAAAPTHCYVFLARVAELTHKHRLKEKGKSHSQTICDGFLTSRPTGLQAKARYVPTSIGNLRCECGAGCSSCLLLSTVVNHCLEQA
jgi:hypothetical protein